MRQYVLNSELPAASRYRVSLQECDGRRAGEMNLPGWILAGFLLTQYTATAIIPQTHSSCGLSQCRCDRGKLACDCSTSQVKEILLSHEQLADNKLSSISISHCAHLHVAANALLSQPALQQISIDDVTHVSLESEAFHYAANTSRHTGLLVNITGTAIGEVPSYCFKGALRDVLFSRVNISKLNAFAFSAIDRAEKVTFHSVNVDLVESQAFKQICVDFFAFIDFEAREIRSRSLINVKVNQEVRLHAVKAARIQTGAINVHECRSFKLSDSVVGHVEHRAFRLHTKGDVFIDDNVFHFVEKDAFFGINVDDRYCKTAGKQDLVFENNTLVEFEGAALAFNTACWVPRLDWVVINQTCSCASVATWTGDLVTLSPDFKTKLPYPQVEKITYCLNPRPTSISEYTTLCGATERSLLAKLLIISGVIVAFAAIGLIIYCGIKHRGKKYINVLRGKKGPVLVVPEGKTYRETELHVILEHVPAIGATEYVRERPDRRESD